ncbi:HET-domain-containing protein [Stipitochalara longipes BDJ]|nr:HET-domain-containing protein [Stipitochalara longipes BDJ]
MDRDMEGESSAKYEVRMNPLGRQSLGLSMSSRATAGLLETSSASGTQHDYRYSLLPNSKIYIRLLKLIAEGQEIVGSLEAFPISEAPSFCALSYAWGSDPPTSSFICDSARLPVTEHLITGMKRVRPHNPTPWIWVDAICINQIDNEEKADQIPLMQKIYSNAISVLAWLGETTEDTESALGQLEYIRDRLKVIPTIVVHGKDQYAKVGLPPVDDPIWKSLAEFLCRSWFLRLWVLQEVTLAKDIIFICGGQVLGLELLRSFNHEINRTGVYSYLLQGSNRFGKVTGNEFLRGLGANREVFSKSKLDPVFLLNRGRDLQVKEPVDRVYGLLGLMEPEIKKSLYMRNLFQLWKHRSFFVTDSGRIGLCSLSCKPGDIVCIFLSLNHTYVVRHVPEKSSVKLICSAYTDGVMYGEALGERDPARDEIFIID